MIFIHLDELTGNEAHADWTIIVQDGKIFLMCSPELSETLCTTSELKDRLAEMGCDQQVISSIMSRIEGK